MALTPVAIPSQNTTLPKKSVNQLSVGGILKGEIQ
jgi:hypothetical protein